MSSSTKSANGAKIPAVTRPSASILLISPSNQILLLHRVQTSSSFPSVHVFPGGNLSTKQDGMIPEPSGKDRHEDSKVYRIGAIRECFEESGILLAKKKDDPERLLEIGDKELYAARHAIHQNTINFQDWVQSKGGFPDIDSLIPFTRWITPPNLAKRFTTQMYIYFLPQANNSPESTVESLSAKSEAMIANPTSDGGVEHTTARFLPPWEWLELSRAGKVILFPPQFFLLHLLAPILCPRPSQTVIDPAELARQRQKVVEFVKTGDPPWTEKCISPIGLLWKQDDGRAVLGLDKPGLELEGSTRKGDPERAVLVDFQKGGPRKVEVVWKKDVFRIDRASTGSREKL